ncbi:AGE family epimerase/isomerase [Algoriphagus sp. H41]|uniref:AGE family epimerase/isomerase n=1 Tax=Algoriphagus oliviformis TaxID=2811231 RepID=A0ABS3C205_9BACT|nr:AGE family epimerase/isomerase [Algoriphagus oliviformis]MBN7811137.1 AGE family epimerase/isomerase [Algoriphagus oliviformis]
MKNRCFLLLFSVASLLFSCQKEDPQLLLADQIEHHLRTEVLDKWYPQAVDTVDGGFFSTFSYDFQPVGEQDKMIVTQSRHVWTNAKAAERYPEVEHYATGAEHGFLFLRDKFWDAENGGFFWLLDKKGKVKGDSAKTAYGNAFGIYALAAYYKQSGSPEALDLAKKAFHWLDSGAHDPVYKGYFQHLDRHGRPIARPADTPSTSDLGYKDQNSSIHLLEAFSELYQVWPDGLLRDRLEEMLVLIRDTIVTDRGHLTLFLYPDWSPVTFADSSESVIEAHHQLDHVSFGHDVETAFLMLEASHVLGLEDDERTLEVAKKMVDQALKLGWDAEKGGFYDEGYYFPEGYRVTRPTKNWWAQAEGLNSLLLFHSLYPEDPNDYYGKFLQLWGYTDTYLIDHEYGDWYAGGLDQQPELKTANKGHIWKGIYHHYRSLEAVIQRLRGNAGHD